MEFFHSISKAILPNRIYAGGDDSQPTLMQFEKISLSDLDNFI